MAHSNATQNQRILDYLDRFGEITQFDAFVDLGIMRLASRISDLRKRGYPIKSEMVGVQNRFGETCRVKKYTIDKEAQRQ